MSRAGAKKVTVLNLWATWCGPCKDEMPELVSFRKTYAPKGVELLLVSGDSAEDLKEAAAFLTAQGVNFPAYRLTEAPDEFMKPLLPDWSATVPTTLIFDAKGKRIAAWVGRVSRKSLESAVDKALNELAPGLASEHAPGLATTGKIGSDKKSK